MQCLHAALLIARQIAASLHQSSPEQNLFPLPPLFSLEKATSRACSRRPRPLAGRCCAPRFHQTAARWRRRVRAPQRGGAGWAGVGLAARQHIRTPHRKSSAAAPPKSCLPALTHPPPAPHRRSGASGRARRGSWCAGGGHAGSSGADGGSKAAAPSQMVAHPRVAAQRPDAAAVLRRSGLSEFEGGSTAV